MKSLHTNIHLLKPDVDRDAPFAYSWFTRPEGHATLLSMGNSENEIEPSTLEGERAIMQEFIDLEDSGKQITRVIVADSKSVGVVWIELFENHSVKSPSIHIMIGDPNYRGKGIGKSAMQSAIHYIRGVLKLKTVHSRHLAGNIPVTVLLDSLGFEEDGVAYTDTDGLVWQNVVLR